MENIQLKPLMCFLVLSAVFIIPVHGLISDSVQLTTPIWSNETGENRDVLVQCSGDGKYVVSGSDTGILRMYDQTGKTLWTVQRDGKMIRSITISGNGDYVGAVFLNPDATSFYAKGEILFFNRTGSALWNYVDDYTMERIAISDDGNSIYTSGSPRLYSFDRNGTIIGQNESQGRTWVLAVADDGSYAVAGGTIMEKIQVAGSQTPANRIYAFEKDGTIAWNYSTRQSIKSVGISSDGTVIVSATGSQIYEFDRIGTLLWQFNSSQEIREAVVSGNGEYVVAGSQNAVILLNRTGSILWNYGHHSRILSVGISDDGNHIAAGAADGVYIFNKTGNVLWHFGTLKSVFHISVARNGRYFATSTSDTTYFFNKWGNATLIDEPNIPVKSSYPNSSSSVAMPSTPKPTPLSYMGVIGALFCISVVLSFKKKSLCLHCF
ncbi:MAG: DUF5711 family protein [Methanoregula sp.]